MSHEKITSRSGNVRYFAMLIMPVYYSCYFIFEIKAAPDIFEAKIMLHHSSQFRYLPAINPVKEKIVTKEAIPIAISKLQSLMAINVTGKMNSKKAHMMTLRKCGSEEQFGFSRASRLKRYALYIPWGRKNLTYKIGKYSERLSRTTVGEEIGKALAVWSEYTDLSFTLFNGQVDIEIRFERGVHGDGNPFDGRQGNILAHAFYPWFGGDVHFDDDEEWTINSSSGTNLFQVAVHEFGHSLGLGHSKIKFAVMSSEYKSYDPNFILDKDDIMGIQAIYGPKTTDDVPHLCTDPKIDTIFKSRMGQIYVFRGKYYWKLMADGIAHGYPKLIGKRWSRLPGNIDAAITHKNGSTFFFKHSKYWKYVGNRMAGNYPKEIDVGFRKISKYRLAQFKLSIKASRIKSTFVMKNRCSLYARRLSFPHEQEHSVHLF